MNETKPAYVETSDILQLAISDEPESGSITISPNITVDLNKKWFHAFNIPFSRAFFMSSVDQFISILLIRTNRRQYPGRID